MPRAVYCQPQVASVGLTAAAARERGHEVSVGRFPYGASGRAPAVDGGAGVRETHRRCQSQKLLGAQVVRHDATELIAQASLASQLDKGIDVAPDRITVGEFLPRWLALHHSEGHIVDTTRDRYDRIVRKHLVPALGHLRLQELRPDHIAAVKSQWLTGENSTGDKPLANSTVHQHLVVLGAALDQAVRQQLIVRNPLDSVTIPSGKSGLDERRALDDSEIGHLLSAASGGRLFAPVAVLLQTGVREGELLALKWPDVDLEARIVTITRGTPLRAREGPCHR